MGGRGGGGGEGHPGGWEDDLTSLINLERMPAQPSPGSYYIKEGYLHVLPACLVVFENLHQGAISIRNQSYTKIT